MTLHYDIPDLVRYINWSYFFFAWQLKQADEQQRIRSEAEAFLCQVSGQYKVHAVFRLFEAYSEGDDIVLTAERTDSAEPSLQAEYEIRIPCLRQQSGPSPYLCLADFIAPKTGAQPGSHLSSLTSLHSPLVTHLYSELGLFATSVDRGMETDFGHDPYQKMMAQLLADRLAEAAAEKLHESVRRDYWGYAPEEQLSVEALHQERFQGLRPAVGYPSLPDASINFLLDRLLGFPQIGIRLTESGAMRPHASVSGLMLAHPEARYFSVGKIGTDQLADYARRRGIPVEVARRFLAANL